jgi:hypothetical protein
MVALRAADAREGPRARQGSRGPPCRGGGASATAAPKPRHVAGSANRAGARAQGGLRHGVACKEGEGLGVGEDAPRTTPEPRHGRGPHHGRAGGEGRGSSGSVAQEGAAEPGKKRVREGEEEGNEAHRGKGEGGRRRGAARASWRRERNNVRRGVEEMSREVVFGWGLTGGPHQGRRRRLGNCLARTRVEEAGGHWGG